MKTFFLLLLLVFVFCIYVVFTKTKGTVSSKSTANPSNTPVPTQACDNSNASEDFCKAKAACNGKLKDFTSGWAGGETFHCF